MSSSRGKIKKIKLHPFSFEVLTSALQGIEGDIHEGASSHKKVIQLPPFPRVSPDKPLELGDLPAEVLMCIFDHLSYRDLKWSVMLVCTKWNALLQSSSITGTGRIDVALYRDMPRVSSVPQPPSPPPEDSDEENANPDENDEEEADETCDIEAFYDGPIWYTHPIFNLLSYRCCKPITDFKMVYRSKTTGDLQIHGIPENLLEENAVTPAVNCLRLRRASSLWDAVDLTGTKPNGSVTVRDILNGVIFMVRDNMLAYLDDELTAEAKKLVWDGIQFTNVGQRKGLVMVSYCLKSTQRGY